MHMLGIDPGQSGGCALIGDGTVQVWAFKDMTDKDILELFESFSIYTVQAVLESVHSFPRQGVASTFKFGQHYGSLRMALLASRLSWTTVTPDKWKRSMGLLRKKGMSESAYKNMSRSRAQELFPSVKVTHATAEALLLAEYGKARRRDIGDG